MLLPYPLPTLLSSFSHPPPPAPRPAGADEEEKPRPRRAQSRNTTAGVIPVDVSAPKVGHALYFERLLLSQDEPQLHITLGYTEASNSRGWCC